MAKASFEGFILDVNRTESDRSGAITCVDFSLLARSCSTDLHKTKESYNYWQPIKFVCSGHELHKLQSAISRLERGDYITVETEKVGKKWNVTKIAFAKDNAQDFRSLLALNEKII